jgi:DNA-binding response OmpR family regulator
MSKRILSVSYDLSLLATRQMMLEQKGYHVTSALGFTDALDGCKNDGFDLFILGHSIPAKDKSALIQVFRQHCKSPIVSLERPGEERAPCDFHVSPENPEELLKNVDSILRARNISEEKSQQPSSAPGEAG